MSPENYDYLPLGTRNKACPVCDAHYVFSFVNVSDYGSNNDSGIVEYSPLGKSLKKTTRHPSSRTSGWL